MIKFPLEVQKKSYRAYREAIRGTRCIGVDITHYFKRIRCYGVVALVPKGEDTFISMGVEKPGLEVYHYIEANADGCGSIIGAVTDGKIVMPTYQTGWPERYAWKNEWRLLNHGNELSPDRRWRATVFRHLTDIDVIMIQAALEGWWDGLSKDS